MLYSLAKYSTSILMEQTITYCTFNQTCVSGFNVVAAQCTVRTHWYNFNTLSLQDL